MSMQVRIAERAAVQERRVIEQRAVAFRRRGELAQERREQLRLIGVELRVTLDVLGLLLMVRHRVMPLREPDLRVRAEVELAAEHERDDAREVRLKREPLKLVHELHVLAERFRNAGRALERGQARVVAEPLDRLNSPLDLADRLEILVDLDAVGRTKVARQAPEIRADEIEN